MELGLMNGSRGWCCYDFCASDSHFGLSFDPQQLLDLLARHCFSLQQGLGKSVQVFVMLLQNRFCSLICCLHKPFDLQTQVFQFKHFAWKTADWSGRLLMPGQTLYVNNIPLPPQQILFLMTGFYHHPHSLC